MPRILKALGVALLFSAALALSLPGIRAVPVAGADPAAAAVTEGPMCREQAAPQASFARVAEEFQNRLPAEAPTPVALNTRGYNYRSQQPLPNLQRIRQEMQLARSPR